MDTKVTKKEPGISKFWPEPDIIISDTREAVKRFIYPVKSETLIHRPPGQCISISRQGDEDAGIGGEYVELWLDIGYLDEVDLLNLKETLEEAFTALWDFPAIVKLPGEE